MRILKIILGVLALLVAAAQYAMTGGLWNVPPGAIAFVGAVAGFFFALGIAPIALPPRLAQILGAAAGLISTVVGIHGANVNRGANPHPWVWATVAVIGILAGAAGRLQLPPKPAAPLPPAPGAP